ncbi:hypothetical protein E3O62_02400 [Cryobacterium sp. TMT2-15-1]|uniref:hypothetical protein n=1 Tax=Cryobacterium sp. TMT2-15-1 TaxID=1259246 RepID=UPI00106B5DE6|nr:hypothetical protein [Cryobacterium sp. TMT2-15-1]TFC63697.1 hypothetical protein E3O62_02400 [Cryobacterium sp. TMT2-15-1]
MNKAWSLFWLVVASVVAFVIIADLLKPYMVSVAIVFSIVVLALIVIKVFGTIRKNRQFINR